MYPLPRTHAPQTTPQGPKNTFHAPGATQKISGCYTQGPKNAAEFLLYYG